MKKGLIISLLEANYNIVNAQPVVDEIDAVVVGMDRNLTYKKLTIGLQACLAGARFIATNPDPQFPIPDGFLPGAGCMIGALSRSLGKEPEIICGKPNPLLADILLSQLDLKPENTVMIGDRVSTDLKFAQNSNIKPILIKTGFGKDEFETFPNFPYFKVFNTLL